MHPFCMSQLLIGFRINTSGSRDRDTVDVECGVNCLACGKQIKFNNFNGFCQFPEPEQL